jgi:hypothetical protein
MKENVNCISNKTLPHLVCEICGLETWRSLGKEWMVCEYCGNAKVVNLLDHLMDDKCEGEIKMEGKRYGVVVRRDHQNQDIIDILCVCDSGEEFKEVKKYLRKKRSSYLGDVEIFIVKDAKDFMTLEEDGLSHGDAGTWPCNDES